MLEKPSDPVEDERETVAEKVMVMRGISVGLPFEGGEEMVKVKGKGKGKGKEMTPESKTPMEAGPETAALGIEDAVARLLRNWETYSDIDSDGWNIDAPSLHEELGNGGVILVLFETPSGFALFSYDGLKLCRPQAIEDIWIDFMDGEMADSAVWRKDFQIFKDKTSAISRDTGVNEQLAMMIRNHIVPGQKLAVGKMEYKHIIEDKLEIDCLFDNTVVELMWGLKKCMHHLLPEEREKLTKEDHRHMSEGMKIVLDRYKLDVEPEMVNEAIIVVTGTVYCCDLRVNVYSQSLRSAGQRLKEISNIDTKDWGLVKLASALRILCFPHDKHPFNPLKVLSQDEYDKLTTHGHMYADKLLKGPCKMAFDEVVSARLLRNRTLRRLAHLVRQAREEYVANV